MYLHMLQFLEHMYVRAIVIWVFQSNGLLRTFYYFNKNAEDNKNKNDKHNFRLPELI